VGFRGDLEVQSGGRAGSSCGNTLMHDARFSALLDECKNTFNAVADPYKTWRKSTIASVIHR
jgi:hypothetical protein